MRVIRFNDEIYSLCERKKKILKLKGWMETTQ